MVSKHLRTWFPRLVTFAAVAALGIGLCSCSSNSCTTHRECLQSPAAEEVGRCAPKEAYCSDGECAASCAKLCTIVEPTFDPCGAGLLCNESASRRVELPYCTGAPIECSTPADCPLYLPSDAGAWACVDGECRFPDFRYAHE